MNGKRKQTIHEPEIIPMLKTVEQMSKYSGIGINKLRELINNREIEFIQNGNRCLLADQAIWGVVQQKLHQTNAM